jgi:hypothetical protein
MRKVKFVFAWKNAGHKQKDYFVGHCADGNKAVSNAVVLDVRAQMIFKGKIFEIKTSN